MVVKRAVFSIDSFLTRNAACIGWTSHAVLIPQALFALLVGHSSLVVVSQMSASCEMSSWDAASVTSQSS